MSNLSTYQENLIQKELDYTQLQIKKATPYLDHIQQPSQNGNTKPLTNKDRAFAWYYVFNGFNKADAYKRMKYGKYNKKTNELELIIPESKQKNSNFNINCSVYSAVLFKKDYMQKCIDLIQSEHVKNIKHDLNQIYTEQLVIQSTYDPAMFIDQSGKPVFNSWDDIPQKYRCCVTSIETKYYGKNADRKVTIIKLVDRDKAREQLFKFIDTVKLNNERLEVIHKTIDKDNNEIGISDIPDMDTPTLERLLEKLHKDDK